MTKRDLRFEKNLDQPVSSIMTPRENLVTVGEGARTRTRCLICFTSIGSSACSWSTTTGELKGMITVKDITKSTVYPLACKDEQGRLRVGAAVGTGPETEERVAALVDAEVDVIVVDTAHGHSRGVIDRIAWVKKQLPRPAGDRRQYCHRRRGA